MQLDNMLLQACKNNQKAVVQTFLKRGGVDVNKRDESGNTPLHFAAQSGNFQIISLLCEAGADVNCTDNDGVTPLMLLAQNSRTDAALKLLKNPELDCAIKDNGGRMAIDYATSAGLKDLVAALSQAGEAHADAYGNTTLHHACWSEQCEVVKILLEKDPDSANRLNDEGESPLILAARRSNLVIVQLLLDNGARPDCGDADGIVPLHIAAEKGELFLGKALLAAGADLNRKASDGRTPLIFAARNGKNDFTAMLIEAGADVNSVDNRQHSALFYASEAGYAEIVEQLLMAGADA